jgi:hypothetical protein
MLISFLFFVRFWLPCKNTNLFQQRGKNRYLCVAMGNKPVTDCHGLKMRAPDGKMRLTDVAEGSELYEKIVQLKLENQQRPSFRIASVGFALQGCVPYFLLRLS